LEPVTAGSQSFFGVHPGGLLAPLAIMQNDAIFCVTEQLKLHTPKNFN